MQAELTEPCGAYVTFDQAEKQRIEDAGQALVRGEVGAVDSLIAAAEPLCTIVTGQVIKPYKRLWDRRGEFRDVAKEVLAKAVRKLDSKFMDGTQASSKVSGRI
ncbi:MAG TPA: hypothetical protein VGI40_18040 [Pirellulaceae bacterium]|jgi:hypothetical protein